MSTIKKEDHPGRERREPPPPGAAFLVLVAAGIVALGLLLEGRYGLNLCDEGFLWEGVLKVRQGFVPVRDFHSYDPARYYWCAAGSYLFGPGVGGLRLSAALFGFLGLVFGLFAAARVLPSRVGLVVVGLMLWVWMAPYYKLFDCTASLVALWALTRAAERPGLGRVFAAGSLPGLLALVGRNHAAYTLAGSFGLMLYLAWKRPDLRSPRAAGAWGAGLLAGCAPFVGFCLWVPGFLDGYREWLHALASSGRTNLPLPVPWPWRGLPADCPRSVALAIRATGWGFVAAPVLCALLAVRALRAPADGLPARALTVAAAFLGPCYLHHAFARADTEHLVQGSIPLLLGLVGLLCTLRPRALFLIALGGLLAFTAVATSNLHPLGQCLRERQHGLRWPSYDVAGTRLRLPPWEIAFLERARAAVAAYCPGGEPFLVVPYEATLYPFLGRTCPVFNAYPLFPASAASQRQMLADLDRHGVRLVLVCDAPLDGQPERRFSLNHPLIWQELAHSFRRLPPIAGLPGIEAFLRVDAGASGGPAPPAAQAP